MFAEGNEFSDNLYKEIEGFNMLQLLSIAKNNQLSKLVDKQNSKSVE
jgi:hypothetical protein